MIKIIQHISLFLMIVCATKSYSQERIGTMAPDFKLFLTDGTVVEKKDFDGKVIVLKFWFTSCIPCRVEIPRLNKIVESYKDNDNIVFLAPALDRSDIVKDFLVKTPFKYKVAYSAYDVSEKYNLSGVYPSHFVIDKSGNFFYIDSATKQSDIGALELAISKTLK